MGRPGLWMDDSGNEGGAVDLYLQYTSLVTGGIPATLFRSVGFGIPASGVAAVAAITRTGVGLFTIQFDQAWAQKWLDFQFYCQQAAYSAAGACEAQILTDNLMATTGVMTVEITNAAGAAVDPTTGDFVSFHFKMQSHAPGQ